MRSRGGRNPACEGEKKITEVDSKSDGGAGEVIVPPFFCRRHVPPFFCRRFCRLTVRGKEYIINNIVNKYAGKMCSINELTQEWR